ncbi:MAG: polynucleotide adenylyltransferase PcnB, partial [Gammaproteobacteria bacterium]|nr:polynucleotide adenylyltransferase PcnB [Gammaproteobacteria bacterium]
AYLLDDVPAARLFEEVLKLFLGGSAVHTFEKLRQYDLFKHLFPLTDHVLEQEEQHFPIQFVMQGLVNTDSRIREDKPVTPAFLFAVFLWEPVRKAFEERVLQGLIPQTAMFDAADSVLAQQLRKISIPRRFSGPMKEIWNLQLRLERGRNAKKARRLIEHPRFRAAYDFLLLRAESGEVESSQAEWWTRYQEGQPELQQKPKKKASGRKNYRSRNRQRKPGGNGNSQS